MKYNHSLEKAKAYAEKALARMAKGKLPPSPSIFELWYVYESGMDAEVTRSIDIMIKGGHEMSEDRCIELHNRLLNTSLRSEEALTKTEGLVAETISNVSAAAAAVHTKTEAHAGAIANTAGAFALAAATWIVVAVAARRTLVDRVAAPLAAALMALGLWYTFEFRFAGMDAFVHLLPAFVVAALCAGPLAVSLQQVAAPGATARSPGRTRHACWRFTASSPTPRSGQSTHSTARAQSPAVTAQSMRSWPIASS